MINQIYYLFYALLVFKNFATQQFKFTLQQCDQYLLPVLPKESRGYSVPELRIHSCCQQQNIYHALLVVLTHMYPQSQVCQENIFGVWHLYLKLCQHNKLSGDRVGANWQRRKIANEEAELQQMHLKLFFFFLENFRIYTQILKRDFFFI